MDIRIENLKKQYSKCTVIDIERLDVKSGEILGIVGNNGAGKTTLFRLLLDLIKADCGTVEYQDIVSGISINPARSEDFKAFTGAYLDEGFLIDFLTAEEYFDFIGKVSGISNTEVKDTIEQYKPFFGDEILGRGKLIRTLSAGNKQKVGIIAALLSRPKVLILDEPFNFLDPTGQNFLKQMLLEYNKRENATIMISSHNLSHTVDISHRVVLLEKGKVISFLGNNNGEAKAQLDKYFNV